MKYMYTLLALVLLAMPAMAGPRYVVVGGRFGSSRFGSSFYSGGSYYAQPTILTQTLPEVIQVAPTVVTAAPTVVAPTVVAPTYVQPQVVVVSNFGYSYNTNRVIIVGRRR